MVSRQPHRARRVPKFPAFLVTGGLVGLITGVLVAMFGPDDPRYGPSTAIGFLGLLCAALGVLVGGIVAVLLDRRA
jgi:hypothetical protein